jgi:hypothetical protein
MVRNFICFIIWQPVPGLERDQGPGDALDVTWKTVAENAGLILLAIGLVFPNSVKLVSETDRSQRHDLGQIQRLALPSKHRVL